MDLVELHTLQGHLAPIRVVKFNGNGNYCMSGGYDKQIMLWNPHQRKQIKTFKGHGYQVMDLDIAPDNGSFVSCGGDKQPFLWDVGTGTVVRKVKGHEQMINSISFNEDASIFATASYDRTAKIWDCKSRSFDPIQSLDDAGDSVTSIGFGESEILTSSVDGCLRTYDLRKGQIRIDHVGCPLTSLTISKCGRMVLLSCLDNSLKVLDRADGTLIREFNGHRNSEFKLDCVFFGNDAFVASGSEDGRLYTWNMESDKTCSILAHNRMVSGIDAHPEEDMLVSCSADTEIKLWKCQKIAESSDTSGLS